MNTGSSLIFDLALFFLGVDVMAGIDLMTSMNVMISLSEGELV